MTRLLLLSGINGNGYVGKYIMSHQYQIVEGIWDTTITNPSEGQTGANATIDEFNGDNFDHTGLGFIEGASITSIWRQHPRHRRRFILGPRRLQARPSPQPELGQSRKTFLKQYFKRTMGLIAQLPTLPYEANVVDLDPTTVDSIGLPVLRVTYNGYTNETLTGSFLQSKMSAILKQAGASSTLNGPLLVPPWNNHETGTCRMGTDPTKSVVNQYSRSPGSCRTCSSFPAPFPNVLRLQSDANHRSLGLLERQLTTTQVKNGGV